MTAGDGEYIDRRKRAKQSTINLRGIKRAEYKKKQDPLSFSAHALPHFA